MSKFDLVMLWLGRGVFLAALFYVFYIIVMITLSTTGLLCKLRGHKYEQVPYRCDRCLKAPKHDRYLED